MRIVVDATAVCRPNRTGIARYTIALIDALLQGGRDVRLAYRLTRWRRRALRYLPPGVPSLWFQEPFLPLPLPLLRPCEVIHGTDARVPRFPGAARVATLHDVFSLLFSEFADERFREGKRRAYQRLAATCDRIIAVSAATRADFLRFVDFPADRVDVVHEGVGEEFQPREAEEVAGAIAHYRLPKRYVLYVGEISSRKNLPGLIEGFAEARIERDVHLVIAGSLSHGAHEALAPLQRAAVERRVHLLGYVPQDLLPSLYAGAQAFVFPTFYEGFGLPVLEAMASGTPVVGGSTGAVPEIAGGHAVLVDPKDPTAIGAGVVAALEKPAAAREAAREHARAFTWARCAAETCAVYERALARRERP